MSASFALSALSMSDSTRNENQGPASDLPNKWQLFLVNSALKVVAARTSEVGISDTSLRAGPIDLADLLADKDFDLAEVGELLVCLEDMPGESELRLSLGTPRMTVVARRVEGAAGVSCVILRPGMDAESEAFLPRAWAWATEVCRSMKLLDQKPGIAPLQILVVDQNPEVVSYGKTLARKLGCRSSGALSGGEALALAKSHLFDLVLVDDLMPGLGAAAFCQLVQDHSERNWGRKPVIAAMTNDIRRHQDSGLLSLEKPIGLGELKVVVHAARLRRGDLRREREAIEELPIVKLEIWADNRLVLCRLAQALVAQGSELATKVAESSSFAGSADFTSDLESLLNGCEILHAYRLAAACRSMLGEREDTDFRSEEGKLDALLVEIESFRIFALGQGLLRNRD